MVKKLRNHSIKSSVMTDEEVYNTLLEAANEGGGGGGGGGGGETWPDIVQCQQGGGYTIPSGYRANVSFFCPSANGQHYFTINGTTFYQGGFMSTAVRTVYNVCRLELSSGTVIGGTMMMFIELRLI